MKHTKLSIAIIFTMIAFCAKAQWTTDGTNIWNTNTGNVGINNTTPTTKLSVRGPNNSATTNIASFLAANRTQGIGIGYNAFRSMGSNADVNMSFYTRGNGFFSFYTLDTERIHINTVGDLELFGNNDGASTIGALRFGFGSGEAIASKRTTGDNQFGLNFYTGSQNRMSISNSGNVGIGIGNRQANYRLEVVPPTSFGTGTQFWDYIQQYAIAVNGNTIVASGNAGDQDIQYYSKGNSGAHVFYTNSTILQSPNERMRITGDGLIGIGTGTPSSLFTVSGIESTTHGKKACIQLTNTATGGKNWYIRAGATGTGTPSGGISIADDNFYRFAIDSNGNVGIGTLTPFRKLEAAGDARFTSTSGSRYLEFFRQGSGANQYDWRFDHDGTALYVSASSNDFSSFCDVAKFGTCSDTYKFTVFGSALASGGTWVNSDLKLKKNINDFSNAVDIIKQLKPKTYFFKTDEYSYLNLPGRKQYGFIAQELEKVLPELVQASDEVVNVGAKGERKTEEIKAVNYTALIPVLTKAIQEQQEQIEELQQEINALKQGVNLDKSGALSANATNNLSAINAEIGQNTPNPFTNATNIQYNVPSNSKNVQLLITNNAGRMVKQFTLTAGKGMVNIDASSLSSGTYNYSLIVDGKIIESKKMDVAR